jgi:uncharacterized protein YjcR
MTRPRVYTLTEAAEHHGVSPSTVRSWMRFDPAKPDRLLLEPVSDSWAMLGYHLFTEPALAEAERENRAGRIRRKTYRTQYARME